MTKKRETFEQEMNWEREIIEKRKIMVKAERKEVS